MDQDQPVWSGELEDSEGPRDWSAVLTEEGKADMLLVDEVWVMMIYRAVGEECEASVG